MGVSDRGLQVQLTQEEKIASDFSLIRAIFVFAGFVSALAAAFRRPSLRENGISPLRRTLPTRPGGAQ